MSGTFPTLAPDSIRLSSQQPTLTSLTHSLKRQARSRGGQRWSIALTFNNRRRSELAPLLAFALAQRGQLSTFQYVPPLIGTTQGSATTVTCSGATAAGLRSVPVTSNGTLKAGDLIKFANHAKVYMLTADAASGAVSLAIEPALQAAVVNAEVVTVSAVPMTMAFAADTHDTDVASGAILSWSCQLVEVP
jgi:hypothetical protein